MEIITRALHRSTLDMVKLAVIQLKVGRCKEKNLESAAAKVKEAAESGAQLVALPECFNSPYGVKFFPEYAETIPGQTFNFLSTTAKERKIWLIGGSFPERDGDKLFNTCTVFNPSGDLVAKHRKVHLFDIDIPGKVKFTESDALSPGNELTTFDVDSLRVGMGICYDIRFAEMAQLYAKKGCHLLVYPGAFTLVTGAAHWELLVRARAVDNQVYAAVVSPARDETADFQAHGHSSVADPWGSIIATTSEKEDIVFCDIDISRIEEVRQQIPLRNQRRNDIYEVKEC